MVQPPTNEGQYFSGASFAGTPSGGTMTGGENGEGMLYSLSMGYAPNGDVLNANDSVNGNWSSYQYDAMNRLISAACTGHCPNGGSSQSFTYDYDRYGNRWHQNTSPSGSTLYTFTANTNQITGSGISYDALGNVKTDGLGNTFTYDAENRIASADSGSISYVYGASGERVRKVSGATYDYITDLSGSTITELTGGSVTRTEVFAGGRHLATYTGGASGTTYFSHPDWLGTERVRSTVTGPACETVTSVAFGDQVTTAGTCEPSPLHFTAKQRDMETGLDDFLARHYSSIQGRFMSPDPKIPSFKHLVDPQKWNKYAYTLNNPVRYFDPDGFEEMDIQLRAFIPQRTTTVLGSTYAGDNRGFSTSPGASSRTSITVRIETDQSRRADPIISTRVSIGETKKLDANGNVIKAATATAGLPTVSGSRDANGDVLLNFQQDTKNPLSPVPQVLTPGISTDLTVTVPQNGSSVTAEGTTSGFPAVEMNVTPDGQATTNTVLTDPGSNASPFNLFTTNSVLVTQPEPTQCGGDKSPQCSQ